MAWVCNYEANILGNLLMEEAVDKKSFGCVFVTLGICIYPTLLPLSRCDIRSIFKWSTAGFNSVFLLGWSNQG